MRSLQKIIVLAFVCHVSVELLLAIPLQDVSTNAIEDLSSINLKQNTYYTESDGYTMDGGPDSDRIKVVSLEQIIPLVAGTLGPAAPFVQPMLSAIVPIANAVRPILNRVALQLLASLFNSLSNSQNGTDARANTTTTQMTTTTTPPPPPPPPTTTTTTTTTTTSTTKEVTPTTQTSSTTEKETEIEDEDKDEDDTSDEDWEKSLMAGARPLVLGNFGNTDDRFARTLNDVAGTLEEFLRKQMEMQSTYDDDSPMQRELHEKLKKSYGKLLAFKRSLKKVDAK